jgi:hypothetical protein
MYPWQERWREYLASQEAKRLKENQAKGRPSGQHRLTFKDALFFAGMTAAALVLFLIILTILS